MFNYNDKNGIRINTSNNNIYFYQNNIWKAILGIESTNAGKLYLKSPNNLSQMDIMLVNGSNGDYINIGATTQTIGSSIIKSIDGKSVNLDNFKNIQYITFNANICPNDLDSNAVYTAQTDYRPLYATRLNVISANVQGGAECTLYPNGQLKYRYAKISNNMWQDLFPSDPIIYLNDLKGTRSASDKFFWIAVFGWIEIA